MPIAAAAVAALGLAFPAAANPMRVDSEIQEVLVFPGGAVVQRLASVAAGTTRLQLDCLPGGLVAESLQVAADDGLAIGDLTLQTLARDAVPECRSGALEARIRELEDQKATLQAEHEAQAVLLTALKAPLSLPQAAGAAGLAAYAEALKRSAQDALQRQHALQRRQQALDEQLAPLLAERGRQTGADDTLTRLSVRLEARQAGKLRISYRVPRAAWSPVYRAHLDTATSRLRLERLAQIHQSTGEDWNGVRLRLSTTEPTLATQARPPRSWTLLPQPVAPSAVPLAAAAPAPAPMPLARVRADKPASGARPFEATAIEGAFATEYTLPGRLTLLTDGQQASHVLDAGQATEAQLFTRVQPQQEARGYLVAEIPRPSGDWPGGLLQLYRDGEYVGQSRLALGGQSRLSLGFGRDERLRVAVAPAQRGGADAGFLGNRAERREQHVYTLENRSSREMTVQVLEPTPVPQHDDIRVDARFNPEPLPGLWQDQPGIRAWQWRLAPGQSSRLQADYLISHPREMRVLEQR